MKRKFTLGELIIVIAIIGILASILLPSLANAKAEAKLTVCKSNENQIAKGTFLYINTHNGRFPDSNWEAVPDLNYWYPKTFDVRVNMMLFSSHEPTNLFICPDDSEPRPDGNWVNSYNPNGDVYWMWGEWAEYTDFGIIGRVEGKSRFLSEVSPDTNLLIESHYRHSNMGYQGTWGANTYEASWWDVQNCVTTNHTKNRISTTDVDGSVRAVDLFYVFQNRSTKMKAVK